MQGWVWSSENVELSELHHGNERHLANTEIAWNFHLQYFCFLPAESGVGNTVPVKEPCTVFVGRMLLQDTRSCVGGWLGIDYWVADIPKCYNKCRPGPVVPNLFSVVDPFNGVAESYGLKPVIYRTSCPYYKKRLASVICALIIANVSWKSTRNKFT